MSAQHRLHAWLLRTKAIGCMSCHLDAQYAVNVWCAEREWLVLFLCFSCLFAIEHDTARLQGYLGEKRVRQQDVREMEREKRKQVVAA